MSGKRTAVLLTLFRGLLLSIVITLIGMLTIAALAVFARISDSLLCFFNQAIKLIAICLGVRAAIPRGGTRGFATGAVLALYLLLGGGAFSAIGMLGEILIGAAVGGLTGAIRANQSPKSRIKRAKKV